LKKFARFIGIDDGYFVRNVHKKTKLIGAITKHTILDGVLSREITIDGDDVSEKIIDMIKNSNHYYQIRGIILYGITFAGFNIADVELIYKNLGLPIIIVMERPPKDIFYKAIEKYKPNGIELIKKAGPIYKTKTPFGYTYYQVYGIDKDTASNIINNLAIVSKIPEPARVAHMIARGVTKGDSSKPRAGGDSNPGPAG